MPLEKRDVDKILGAFIRSRMIYHQSIYKYGTYRSILAILYPEKSEYYLKKIFDELIQYNYVIQIPNNRSFLYQFNNHSDIDNLPKTEYELTDEGKAILRFD